MASGPYIAILCTHTLNCIVFLGRDQSALNLTFKSYSEYVLCIFVPRCMGISFDVAECINRKSTSLIIHEVYNVSLSSKPCRSSHFSSGCSDNLLDRDTLTGFWCLWDIL